MPFFYCYSNRLFEPETLEYIASVPKPPPVGAIEESTEEDVQEGDKPNVIYADVLASQYDASSSSLVCIYSDRSLLVWDLTDQSQAVMTRYHIFHSDSIWGVEVRNNTQASFDSIQFLSN
jgi:hypothetical protein